MSWGIKQGFATLVFAALALGAPALSQASPGEVTVFPTPETLKIPQRLTRGPDGEIWFDGEYGGVIGQINRGGRVTEHAVTTASGPVAPRALTFDSRGDLWFTGWAEYEKYPGFGAQGVIGRMTPDGNLTVFKVEGQPVDIAPDPAGNGVWFTNETLGFIDPEDSNTVAHLDLAGTVVERALPGRERVEIHGIATGADGNLWLTEAKGVSRSEHGFSPGMGFLVRMTPEFQTAEFPVASAPYSIVSGPEGELWFSEGGKIGRANLNGRITEYPLGEGEVGGLTVGPEGNPWFGTYKGIGRLTPAGQETIFSAPKETYNVATGADGNIWFTSRRQAVGNLSPGGLGMQVLERPFRFGKGPTKILLACGGGEPGQACQGILTLNLTVQFKGHHPKEVLAGRAQYNLASEAGPAPVKVRLRAKARHLLARHPPIWSTYVDASAELPNGQSGEAVLYLPRRSH